MREHALASLARLVKRRQLGPGRLREQQAQKFLLPSAAALHLVSMPLEKRLDGLLGELQIVVGHVAEERRLAGRLHFIELDRREVDEQRLETLHKRLGGQWSAGLHTGGLLDVIRRGRLGVRSSCYSLVTRIVVRRVDL